MWGCLRARVSVALWMKDAGTPRLPAPVLLPLRSPTACLMGLLAWEWHVSEEQFEVWPVNLVPALA